MKIQKKLLKKYDRRQRGYELLLASENYKKYPGAFRRPGSRNPKKQG